MILVILYNNRPVKVEKQEYMCYLKTTQDLYLACSAVPVYSEISVQYYSCTWEYIMLESLFSKMHIYFITKSDAINRLNTVILLDLPFHVSVMVVGIGASFFVAIQFMT